jgi:glycine/D-amino acid oxidase-like deaminating enzyme
MGCFGETLTKTSAIWGMKLTSQYPYWYVRNGLVASYPLLEKDLKCDCVVVGAGITGALVAYHLAEAGVKTVVVDRRDVGTGSTSGSTGLLQYEVDTPLRELTEKVGAKAANRSYRLCGEAILKLRHLVKTLGIQCRFRQKPSLQLAKYKLEIPQLRLEQRFRAKLGIGVEFWSETDISRHFPFTRPAALFSENAAEVDPHLMTHGLLTAAKKKGLLVFNRAKIVALDQMRSGVRLRTEAGHTIRARRAVIAAGFESKHFLRSQSGRLKSTYAFVSEPVQDLSIWFRQSLIWETGLPYLYLRTLPDRRIIVGGEDEPFVNSKRRDRLIAQKEQVLINKFSRLFPSVKMDVAYSWAGTFGETKDGLPYIGRPPAKPHVYFALGYGGNGITYSLIAAEIIRDHFLGRSNHDASIFRFDR